MKNRHTRNAKFWRVTAVLLVICAFAGGVYLQKINEQREKQESLSQNRLWEKAATSPMTAYPEEVLYTLGKMTGDNNSNMPEKDTYENNAYTRYLKKKLNIQNQDVLEVTEDDNYDLMIRRMVMEGNMPDLMVVNDYDYLMKLIENDMVEDLTDAYENCATPLIKSIYESYGEGLLDSVTYDGEMKAISSTQVYPGCSLLWLRDDWRKELGLAVPQTIEDVEQILLAFKENEFDGQKNVGIVSTAGLVGQENSNYSMDPVFEAFGAYPQVWLKDTSGNWQYGSTSSQTKDALEYLNRWYQEGILDEDYMMRTPTEIGNLIQNNQCGAFFGWWWAPNNPLKDAKAANPDAEWVPYLLTDGNGTVNSYIPYQRTKYVVVRKGYEHPELAVKITSALFDYARYKDSTNEIEDYATGVDITARPLVINCDYSNAVFLTTNHLISVLEGTQVSSRLNGLERAYLTQCQSYLAGEKTAETWAAYTSRIQAVGLIEKGNVNYINEEYVQETQGIQSRKLQDMEVLAFMKIVTGEEPISYFDTFVEEWKLNGGEELIEK
ncbi:MAG: sugar ABC transporter substrate-binding protein [Hespellia sp.]|nr:sugar ABC transporter substrate-binding protein [Hespellia sp.]